MLLLLLSSCANTDEIRDKLKDHEKRIEVLEQLVKKANESTSALQALIDKMSKQLTIVKYEELKDGSGYVITMSDGSTITLKNGQGAPAPAVGIKEDEGVYYWTINGDYLLDGSGNRVVAKGKDGSIGITPKLRINKDNQWEVSYDGGKNWSLVRDENGNPIVAVGSADTSNLTIESDGTHVIIVYNGVTYLIPLAPGEAVDPTSISLSPEVMTLRVGDIQTFALSFEPINVTNKEVTWASSNEPVATVDNGVVTAHTIGTAVSEVITIAGITKTYTADYISPGDGNAYGLRFKGDDESQRSAWRYEYLDNPDSPGSTEKPQKMLKITVRRLGGSDTGVTVETIADPSWWASNNTKDIVKIFPAAGFLQYAGDENLTNAGTHGYYWSSTEYNTSSARSMDFFDQGAYTSYYWNGKSYKYSVRLFSNK